MIGAIIAVIAVALIVRDTVLRVHAATHRHADLTAIAERVDELAVRLQKSAAEDEDIAKRLRALEAKAGGRVRA